MEATLKLEIIHAKTYQLRGVSKGLQHAGVLSIDNDGAVNPMNIMTSSSNSNLLNRTAFVNALI